MTDSEAAAPPLEGEVMTPWFATQDEAIAFTGEKSGYGFTYQEEGMLRHHFGAAPSKSGVLVSTRTAFQVATAARAIRVISEGVAQLPLELWDREGERRRRATKHPLHKVLTRRPNPWHTRMGFVETITMHAVVTGNGYAYKTVVDGQITELLPIPPGCCQIVLHQRGERTYRVHWEDGTSEELEQHQILHLAGPSMNGVDGIDWVRELKEVLGLAQAITNQAARFHDRDRRPSGLLTVDGNISPEQRDRIKTAWEAAYGPEGTGRLAVLDKGFKFEPISSTGKDSESLEMLRFQVEEICRLFGVHPVMVMSTAGSGSYASVEQAYLAHLSYTIDPWLTRWEETIARDLLTDADHAAGIYARFNRQAIARVTLEGKANYYQKALGTASSAGWLTPNEVRDLEELDPIDGYDEPFFPRQAAQNAAGGAANLAPSPGGRLRAAGSPGATDSRRPERAAGDLRNDPSLQQEG